MKKGLVKKIVMAAFTFAMLFGLRSTVNAAYTNKVVKTYMLDYNTITGGVSNYRNYTYINVADDAREYNKSATKEPGGGWNYKVFKVTKYYKNADMNW